MAETLRLELRAVAAGLSFLTRAPVGRLVAVDGDDVARSGPAFPVVGAAVGAVVGAVALALSGPLPPLAAGGLALAAGAVVTGAFHLDALADCADALGAFDRERALAIMRDHQIGAYGAVALFLDLLVKASLLAALSGGARVVAVAAAAGACARAMPVALGALLPYARAAGGTGASMAGGSKLRAAIAVALAAAIAVAARGSEGAAILGAAAAVAVLSGLFWRRRIGGVTGDVLGATAELAELAGLAVGAALIL